MPAGFEPAPSGVKIQRAAITPRHRSAYEDRTRATWLRTRRATTTPMRHASPDRESNPGYHLGKVASYRWTTRTSARSRPRTALGASPDRTGGVSRHHRVEHPPSPGATCRASHRNRTGSPSLEAREVSRYPSKARCPRNGAPASRRVRTGRRCTCGATPFACFDTVDYVERDRRAGDRNRTCVRLFTRQVLGTNVSYTSVGAGSSRGRCGRRRSPWGADQRDRWHVPPSAAPRTPEWIRTTGHQLRKLVLFP